MRSTPQLALAKPKADPEKIIRRRKISQERISSPQLGISDDFHHPSIETPILSSHYRVILSTGFS
jgi:hypothetical protein